MKSVSAEFSRSFSSGTVHRDGLFTTSWTSNNIDTLNIWTRVHSHTKTGTKIRLKLTFYAAVGSWCQGPAGATLMTSTDVRPGQRKTQTNTRCKETLRETVQPTVLHRPVPSSLQNWFGFISNCSKSDTHLVSWLSPPGCLNNTQVHMNMC